MSFPPDRDCSVMTTRSFSTRKIPQRPPTRVRLEGLIEVVALDLRPAARSVDHEVERLVRGHRLSAQELRPDAESDLQAVRVERFGVRAQRPILVLLLGGRLVRPDADDAEPRPRPAS